jgi:hypothetical protein
LPTSKTILPLQLGHLIPKESHLAFFPEYTIEYHGVRRSVNKKALSQAVKSIRREKEE